MFIVFEDCCFNSDEIRRFRILHDNPSVMLIEYKNGDSLRLSYRTPDECAAIYKHAVKQVGGTFRKECWLYDEPAPLSTHFPAGVRSGTLKIEG